LSKFNIYLRNKNNQLEIALFKNELPQFNAHQNENVYKLSDRSSASADLILVDEITDNRLIWTSLEDLNSLKAPGGAFLCEALGLLWPKMSSSVEATLELPSWMYKVNNEHRSTFFGGSFNPWHEGHSECIDQCPEENIIIVPDFNPWKEKREEACAFSSFKELCFSLKETPYSVYSGFWGREKSNPTINWLPNVQYKEKGLLIGDDNFLSFNKWQDYRGLLNELDFLYVVPRDFSLQEIKKMKSELESLNTNTSIIILNEHQYQDVSSTKIRKNLNQK